MIPTPLLWFIGVFIGIPLLTALGVWAWDRVAEKI